MTILPFVIRAAGLASIPKTPCNCLTAEDPIPSALASSEGGYVLSLATMKTAINAETTDEN